MPGALPDAKLSMALLSSSTEEGSESISSKVGRREDLQTHFHMRNTSTVGPYPAHMKEHLQTGEDSSGHANTQKGWQPQATLLHSSNKLIKKKKKKKLSITYHPWSSLTAEASSYLLSTRLLCRAPLTDELPLPWWRISEFETAPPSTGSLG